MLTYHKVLTIAGSDSGGGAGIQADLKTFSALNCYGMSVITALTAQNTLGVQAIQSIPTNFIAQQLESVMSDMGADAIKIGMLFSADIIELIAMQLKNISSAIPIVLDPVMVAKGGALLLEENAIEILQKKLLPLVTLITPNILEAEVLLGTSIKSMKDMEDAAQQLTELGCAAALIKGGHLESEESNDCLFIKATKELHWYRSARIKTTNTHGTGCTLSAAIVAFLARGENLASAVQQAKNYLFHAIEFGSQYQLGRGHGPVDHLWQNEKV